MFSDLIPRTIAFLEQCLSLNILNHFITTLCCNIGAVSVFSMLFFWPDYPLVFLTPLVNLVKFGSPVLLRWLGEAGVVLIESY